MGISIIVPYTNLTYYPKIICDAYILEIQIRQNFNFNPTNFDNSTYWFMEDLRRRVRSGHHAFFWNDSCVRFISLKLAFVECILLITIRIGW